MAPILGDSPSECKFFFTKSKYWDPNVTCSSIKNTEVENIWSGVRYNCYKNKAENYLVY